MNLESIDWKGLLGNPVVWGIAGGVLVLGILVAVLKGRGGGKLKTKVVDPAVGRARMRLRTDLRVFRDEVKKVTAAAGPVFRKMDSEASQTQAQAIGHWRKQLNHRIAIRSPDLGALKGVARSLGYDAAPLSDLEVSWKKLERQIQDYNTGRLDNDKTPIATIRQFEKDFGKIVVLANMCLTKYGG